MPLEGPALEGTGREGSPWLDLKIGYYMKARLRRRPLHRCDGDAGGLKASLRGREREVRIISYNNGKNFVWNQTFSGMCSSLL
jgi:hypothetical protein